MFRSQSCQRRARIASALGLGCAALLGACSSSVDESGGSSSSTTSGGASLAPGASATAPRPSAAGTVTPTAPATDTMKTCAQGRATAAPVTPTVWLVVDGSGSMGDDFADTSRWEALRSALMDPGGVVQTLETTVRFGLVIYNGPEENLFDPNIGGNGGNNGGVPGACNAPENINPLCLCFTGYEPFCCQPRCGGMTAMPAPDPMPAPMPDPMQPPMQCENIVVVNPALSNYAAINASYPQEQLGGSTPTHRALERIVSTLPVVNQTLPDDMTGPTYVVLATDGEPNDFCSDSGGGGFQNDVAQRVVEVVRNGVQMGMKMFVVSLAGEDRRLRQHLEEVAGIGSPGQPPFEPAGKDELVDTLRTIIGGTTCQIALDGTVMSDQACTGSVMYNGQNLPCNDPNGWRLVDDHTLQLTGSACEAFLSTPSMVYAQFPCGVFVPQ